MNRKEKIYSFMSSKEYVPLKFNELMLVLDVPETDRNEFEAILEELISEGKIYVTKKSRYASVSGEAFTVSGHITCSAKGFFAFLICEAEEEEDVYISGEDLNGALNGDKVLVRLSQQRNDKNHRCGRIIKILERKNIVLVGVIYKEKHTNLYMRPDNRQIYTKVIIPPEHASGAQMGDRVAVRISEYTDDGQVFGEVTTVLGKEKSLKSCIEGIIIENNIKQEFDEAAQNEALKIPCEVNDEQIRGREDLRDMLIFTIDGDDAKDFDDAVSLSVNENGNYNLGVHIADVSEYVRENTALDAEAYERATSVYLADRVIPMLPEKLSNGICSLNPEKNRLTLSVFMEIDKKGNVLNHRISKTVICSKERMTYNNVNAILERGDGALCEKYSHLLPTLNDMEKLAGILLAKRIRRGAIEFDFPESRIIVDDNGEPVGVEKEIRGISNKMIEELMLVTNETVAEYAFWAELPFIYRNHEAPSIEKISSFNKFIMNFGISLKGKIDRDTPVQPKAFQQILESVSQTPKERIISSVMLRSMMKAVYSSDNLGHFGLAAKYYCHFTSPIRRYPDLVIHRILKSFIDGNFDSSKLTRFNSFVSKASSHSSDGEMRAEYTERDVDDLMKTAYMSRFLGETFEGCVSSVTGFGMFVELSNTIEGLVRLENMSDDYYEFDEQNNCLTGKRRQRSYKIGDTVKVVLAKCDILMRQIDFVLENHYTEKTEKKLTVSVAKKVIERNRNKKNRTNKRVYRKKRIV